ncbi:hypothetical protein [Nonomuraea sp. NPDC050643]|uniref:hypothetical protein n=1 Tax=Nonomuraea sp. NPDC050643 TaxID=3155660 RepID=UPI0033D44B45
MDIERAGAGAGDRVRQRDWTLLPTVVVRSAGFPWALVLSLAYPRAAEAAVAVVELERQALDLLAEGGEGTAGVPAGPAGSGRLSRGLRGRLRDLRPLPADALAPGDWLAAWNKVTGLLEEARLTLTGMVSGDAALVRAAMAGIVADERFLDALVCSSPGLYRDLRRGGKSGEPRRQIAAHLQELSAKSGTAGCFGPINYATIEPGGASGYTWEGHRECARRMAYPAARVGEALQQRILADPGIVAGLVPRRKTWTRAVPDGAAFVGHCDGERTLAEIAAESGTGMERASAALAVAVRRGLLTHDLCPPATIPDTLGWLRERLAAAGVRMTPQPARGPGTPASRGRSPKPAASGRGLPDTVCECGFRHGTATPGHALPDSERRSADDGCDLKEGQAPTPDPSARGDAGGRSSRGDVGGASGGGDGARASSSRRDGAGGPSREDAVGRSSRGDAAGTSARASAMASGVPAQLRRPATGPRPAPDGELPLGRRVGELAELLGQYPAASPDVKLAVQRRIEALAGGGGRDDGVIVHEAAAGTLQVTAGGGLAADLESRVPRVLDLLAAEAELTRLRTNRLLAGRLGAGTFELSQALRATGDLEIQHADHLSARIAAIVRDAPAGATVLNLAGLLDEPAPPAAPVLCTADVMVAASSLQAYEAGTTPLILGDLHDAVLLTPWALQFHEEGAACLAERDTEIRRALSGFTALNVISRRANGLVPLELPGPVLELGGVAADPRRRRVGIDELYVHSDGRRALLHAKGMEEPLLFHNGEHDTALHTALALPRIRPLRLGDLPRVPRLTWDNVVISRRRWRVGRSSFGALGQAAGDRELLVAMARLREIHDLPVTFFVSSARERRPVFVDTRSPALIEELGRLADAADRLTVTEALPGPEGCWLREGEQRFTAELRCVYLRPARSTRADPQAGTQTDARTDVRAEVRGEVRGEVRAEARSGHRHRQVGSPSGAGGPVEGWGGAAVGEPCDQVVGQGRPRPKAAHPYPWPGEGG